MKTCQNNKPIWLVWFQNKETNQLSSFWHWADNADEALQNIAKSFFDDNITGCFSLEVGNCDGHELIKNNFDKEILFPQDKMKLLKIARFEPGDNVGMLKQLEEDRKRYKV